VKVGGKVTLDGAPVEGAVVTLIPASQGTTGRTATGKTDASGQFTLSTTNVITGVVPGEYKATVSKEKVEGALTPEQSQEHFAKTGQAPPPPKVTDELPAKYKDPATSGLTAKVEGAKDLTFELKK
jgi:hypothetical protein